MSDWKILFPVIVVLAVVAVLAAIALKPLDAVAVEIVLIVLAALSFFFLPMLLPKSTSLTVSPSSFALSSGESMAFTATVKSGRLILTGTGTSWTASLGSFDRTSGSVVVYVVPDVVEPTTVVITAAFTGQRSYRSSKATITGTIAPRKAEATTLAVSPSVFEVDSGKRITLNATASPADVPQNQITWQLEGPGALTPISGPSTTYAAPEAKEKATVRITAGFPGTRSYSASKGVAVGTVMPLGVVLRNVTKLTVKPSVLSLVPGGRAELTATLVDEAGNALGGETIGWKLEGPGTLSSKAGPAVTYEAPNEVKDAAVVTIMAEFPEKDGYLRTSAQVTGTIGPASIEEFAYDIHFEKLAITNAELKGPITMLGVNVVEISGSASNVTNLALNPLGLRGASGTFENMRMYAIHLKANCPELSKELEISGEEETKMSMGTLTLESGIATIIYLASTGVALTKPELVGKYVGGDEPYVPVVATTHKVTLEQGYSVQGPTTYEKLANRVNNLIAGKIVATDFTFACPISYSLDRQSKEHSYRAKWTLSASGLTGQNPSILFVFFATTYGGFVIKGTGEQSPSTIIPHGFSAGWKSPPLPDAQVHAVCFTADQLSLKDLVIQIAS